MAREDYRYNVIINASVQTSGVTRGTAESEQQFSRWEKRAVQSIKKVQEAMDKLEKSGLKTGAFDRNAAAAVAAQERINRAILQTETQRVIYSERARNVQIRNQQLIDKEIQRSAIAQQKAAQQTAIANERHKQAELRTAQMVAREKERLAKQQLKDGSLGAISTPLLAGAAALAGAVAYAVKIGTEYETSLNIFQAATSATASEMERAATVATALGNDLKLPGISAKDAALAMTELGKGGLTAAQAIEAARGTLELSIAANIGAAQAAEITANVLNQFSLNAKDAGRVADLLAAAANTASGEITDMSQAVKQSGAVFAGAKIPVETLVTLIGEMAKNGILGSDAGTSLKTMLLAMQAPTQKAAETMRALNVEIYNQNGTMKSMRDVIGQFQTSLSKLTDQQKVQALQTIFGMDAIRAANIIFREGVAGYDAMEKAVTKAGAAQDMATARTKGLGGAIENVKSQLETIALNFYNFIKGPLTSIVQGFGALIGKMGDMPRTTTLVIAGLIALAAALNAVSVSAAISSLATYGKTLSGFIFVIQNTIRAMVGLNTAFVGLEATIAGGLGWAAVALILAGVIVAFKDYESVIEKANKVTVDSINSNAEVLNSYAQMKTEVANVTAVQEGSTDRHERLNAVLGRLEPATQAYIKSLKDEGKQIGALTDDIDKNLKARRSILESQLLTAAQGALAARQEADTIQQQVSRIQFDLNTYYDSLERVKKAKDNNQSTAFMQSEEQVRNLIDRNSSAITDLSVKLDENTQKFNENEIKVIQAAKALSLNNDQLREFLAKAGYTEDQILKITAAYDKLTNNQNAATKSTDSVTDAIKDQTGAVFNLRQELNKLTSVSQEKIDRRTLDIVQNSTTKAEAAAKAKQARTELQTEIDNIRLTNDKVKAVEDILNPKPTSGGGGGGATRSRRVSQTNRDEENRQLDNQLRKFNQAMRSLDEGTKALIQRFAAANGIPTNLAYAQIYSESSFVNGLVGRNKDGSLPPVNQRAYGIAQIQVGTANNARRKRGLSAVSQDQLQNNVEKNLQTWGLVMSDLFSKYGDWDLAILAYHQGEATVDRAIAGKGKIGPQGQAYLKKISKISGVTGNQRFQEVKSDAQLEGERQVEQILKLRSRLNYQTDSPIPNDPKGREEIIRTLQEYDRTLDGIEQKTRDINELLAEMGSDKMIGIAQVFSPEEAKENSKGLDILQRTLMSLRDTELEQIDAQAQLSAEFDDGMTALERFDLQMKKLETSGKFTAEVWQTLIVPALKKSREEIEKTSKLELGRKLRLEAKQAADAVKSLSDGITEQLSGLTGNNSELSKFLSQIEGISELKLKGDAFDKLKETFISSGQIDVDKLAEFVRQWLTLRAVFGDFDVTKIDEIVGKLKSAAEGFNSITRAQKDQQFGSLEEDLLNQLDSLRDNNRELTEYERTLKMIEKDYNNLDPAQKKRLLDIASEIDAQEQLNRTYDKFYNVISDSLQTLADEGFGGLFKSIVSQFKSMLVRMASEWITSTIFKLIYGKGNTGQADGSQQAQSGGNFLQKIFGQIFSMGSGGRATNSITQANSGGVPSVMQTSNSGNRFSLANFLATSNSIPSLTMNASPTSLGGAAQAAGNGLPAVLNQRSNVHSTLTLGHEGLHDLGKIAKGSGGQGFGFNSGTIQGIGSVAGLVGGMIGGTGGSVLMGASMGISTMSSLSSILGISALGGPVGLLVGAAIGAALGLGTALFGRNSKRRKEEKTRNQAMLDAFAALDRLLEDVQADRIDGKSALDQADQIRKQYIDQVSQLTDKKTKNIALRDVSRIDAKIAMIKTAVQNQEGRQRRLALMVPTFAEGGSVRRNPVGYVRGPGGSRSDSILAAFPSAGTLARISNTEYVLDAQTVQNIGVSNLDAIRADRGRSFSRAMTLSKMPMFMPQLADGGAVMNTSVFSSIPSQGSVQVQQPAQPKVSVVNNIVNNGNGISVDTEVYLETPEGKRKLDNAMAEIIYRGGTQGETAKAMKRTFNL